MLAGMGCWRSPASALGLFPSAALRLLDPVTSGLVGAVVPSPAALALRHSAHGSRSYCAASGAAARSLVARSGWPGCSGACSAGPSAVRVAPTWVCGVALEPWMQYTAAALAKPIRIIFSALLRPYREVEREHAAVAALRLRASASRPGLQPVYEPYLYERTVSLLMRRRAQCPGAPERQPAHSTWPTCSPR